MLDVQKDVLLAPFTTFGIGGSADFFITVHSGEELAEAMHFVQAKHLQFFVLGKGANILVGDKGFRGAVIKNDAKNVSMEGCMLIAESGAIIADLINKTEEKGLSGLEHFAGIPSTLGGALWQNLHFLSPDRSTTMFIGDILESAEILKVNDQQLLAREKVGKDYFRFGYDYSILHDTTDIVLSATLLLTPENPAIVKERADANLLWRKEKHPENAVSCSAGSVFKKIEGYGAGRLIEKVRLKGKQIGGAKVSEKHANFILNIGGAKAKDVRELILLIQQTVQEQLGLDLKTEISFIGEF